MDLDYISLFLFDNWYLDIQLDIRKDSEDLNSHNIWHHFDMVNYRKPFAVHYNQYPNSLEDNYKRIRHSDSPYNYH